MIIQHRTDGTIRIITQHDHGLLSGEIAHIWRDANTGEALHHRLVLAITLHDLAWRHADSPQQGAQSLAWDEKKGLPHDFITMPTAQKLIMYAEGIDDLEGVDPYTALLLSHHYSAFVKDPDGQDERQFLDQERRRRARLAGQLGFASPDAPNLLEDFEWLKTLDIISLYACQAAPGADPATIPSWIRSTWRALDQDFTFAYVDADDGVDTIKLIGADVDKPILVEVPYWELERRAYKKSELMQAWQQAELKRWPLRVI